MSENSKSRRPDGQSETPADKRYYDLRDAGYGGRIDADGRAPRLDPRPRDARFPGDLLDGLLRSPGRGEQEPGQDRERSR